MAPASVVAGERRILLDEVSWEVYEALLRCWTERPGRRLTFDRGQLEIMYPLHGHEHYRALIGRFIETFTEERNIPRHSGGATTLRREAKQRGLDPDKCYWIQNEEQMRCRKEFDIELDPPPDLAVEVAITSSLLDRTPIYASLGIPEVWRFDGESLTIHLLQAGATYAPSERSRALPDLPPDEVMRFLRLSDEQDETSLIPYPFLSFLGSQADPGEPQIITRETAPTTKEVRTVMGLEVSVLKEMCFASRVSSDRMGLYDE